MATSHFQTLLEKACVQQVPPAESKLAASMPARYVELRAGQSALSKEAADTVPERIEGALAPNFLNVPGRLIKVHLPDADIRYFSRLYSEEESAFFMKKLNSDKSDNKWDKLLPRTVQRCCSYTKPS